eukprot:CAMPEP_0118891166 /NCGR_PEP_ID=MMETSP1166-20130328/1299_1 /TAXON_ID=1104430 /ORGANISM="Chrysoreinhardia sp, Strain CCMP3193" /LENGTH=129 /DNA_ID=CAMNT_0006829809 /DNA_START=44 /DNA_END=433 /DNA_ORIENTATION=-
MACLGLELIGEEQRRMVIAENPDSDLDSVFEIYYEQELQPATRLRELRLLPTVVQDDDDAGGAEDPRRPPELEGDDDDGALAASMLLLAWAIREEIDLLANLKAQGKLPPAVFDDCKKNLLAILTSSSG